MQLSVIVPVYNVAQYLQEALDSILEQGYDNYECILVNDGSTDGSGEICREYAAREPKIRLIEQENQGLSAARNAGLSVACGKYLYFMDSDDRLYHGGCFSKMMWEIEDYDLLEFQPMYMDAEGEKLHYIHTNGFLLDFPTPESAHCFSEYYLISHPDVLHHMVWTKIYKKEIIDRYQLRFTDTREIVSEDLLFNLCYLLHTWKVKVVPDAWYCYRQERAGSLTEQSRKKQPIRQLCRLFSVYEEYAKRYVSHWNQERWEAHCAIFLQRYLYKIPVERLYEELEDLPIDPDFYSLVRRWGENGYLKEAAGKDIYRGIMRYRFLILHPEAGKKLVRPYSRLQKITQKKRQEKPL